MKRNWDVIRSILMKVEDLPNQHSHVLSNEIEGIKEDVAEYHMRLLGEAGLIIGANLDRESGTCTARKLTWDGHEFLDGIKRETVWRRIKDTLQDKGLDLSYETIKSAVISLTAVVLRSSF